MNIERLREEIPERLRNALGERFEGVLLYGSRARGDAEPDSDIDLLILVNDSCDLGRALDEAIHALYPLQLQVDVPIHAVPVRRSTFEAGTYSMVRNARAEGVEL